MSEEDIKSPLTPVTPKPDKGSLEGSFIAKSSSTKSRKVLSRYLRPPTGSCHDHCKYGKREETELKPRRPIRKRISSKPLDSDGQNSVEIEIFLPGKKPYEVRHSSSAHVKGHISDCDEIVKHEVSAKSPGDADSMESETNNGQYLVVSEDLSLGRKSPQIKVPSSSKFGTQVSDSYDIIKQEIAIYPGSKSDGLAEVTDAQSPVDTEVLVGIKESPGKKFEYSLDCETSASQNNNKHKLVEHSIGSGNSMDTEDFAEENETSVTQQRSGHAIPRLHNSGGIIKKNKWATSSAEMTASPEQASPKNRGKSIMMKAKPLVVKASSAPDSSGSPNRRKNSEMKMGMNAKAKTFVAKPSSAPDSSGFTNSKENSKVRIGTRYGTSKTGSKKVLTSSKSSSEVAVRKVSASHAKSSNLAARKMMSSPSSGATTPISTAGLSLISRKHSSLKDGSPTKYSKKKNGKPIQPKFEEVKEKTLYVIKVDRAKESSEINGHENYAVEPHNVPSLSTSSSTNPDVVASLKKVEEKSKYKSKDKSLSGNTEIIERERSHKRGLRKTSTVASEESDKPVKMNFQRGRVLDVHSQSHSPKRLKFRRVRIMGVSQSAKIDEQRRIFKRRGETAHGKNGEQASPRKVVLRRQGTHGKKDAQGLFNNVIEETASKLVESRKSKVKALVGAFETVISLQETKPAANADTGAGIGSPSI